MSLSPKLSATLKATLLAAAISLPVLPSFTPPPAHAAIFHIRGERPSNLGLRYDRFLDGCPTTPNCISTASDVFDSHYVPAWTYAAGAGKQKTMQEAIKDVTDIVENYPRATIIESKATTGELGVGHYIYAEFESKLLGFVDDVEFFFQPDNKTVEYRSASRLGEKDFDVNRKRIRDIRVALQDKDKRWASVGYN